jgi:hypothetical protein
LGTSDYAALKRRLANGWNTWNTRSVLSHVLLPEGFALNLGFKEYGERAYLKEAAFGRTGAGVEVARPGPHAYDGSYTELSLAWKGLEVTVQSATEANDLVLLVTPLAVPPIKKPPLLAVESGLLWNRPGQLGQEAGALVGSFAGQTVRVYATGPATVDPYLPAQAPYLALALAGPVGVSTGQPRDLDTIRSIIQRRRGEHEARTQKFGNLAELYAALQTAMAWNTIYEPELDRVVTPVSRLYNLNWGGFVLFEWDTYFAAYMASLEHRDLAYANAIEITRLTPQGFVPNETFVCDLKSRGWSQPPVGSLIWRELYRKFGETWPLEFVFDSLLAWNRWWPKARRSGRLLCWGADPYEPILDCPYEFDGMHAWQGAAWESGLDNSPMYDGVPFNQVTNLMELADVGLNSLYIADCNALAEIAGVLGRQAEAQELQARAQEFREALATLWDDATGLYLNRRTDTGELSRRLSPTHFYPLLAGAASRKQAERMLAEHFYNAAEFWGEWMLPSIARNDPAYPEQDYWRGRIWGPMNFLVYVGLRRYRFADAGRDLAEKSQRLLLKEWRERGHIHENFSADTGEGCGQSPSDRFYHWGALLGMPAFIEEGYLAGPEQSLSTRATDHDPTLGLAPAG